MLNPNSPNLDDLLENVVEEVLPERAEEAQREKAEEESQETTLKIVPEEIEVVVEKGDVGAFYSNKGS